MVADRKPRTRLIRIIVGILFVAGAIAVFNSTSRLSQFSDKGYQQYFLTCDSEFLRKPTAGGGTMVIYPSFDSECIKAYYQPYYRDPTQIPVVGLMVALIVAGAIVLSKKNSLASIMLPVRDTERNKIIRKRLGKSAIAFLAVGSLLVVLVHVSYVLYVLEEQKAAVPFARITFGGNYYREYSLFSVLTAISFSIALGLFLARWKHGRAASESLNQSLKSA